MKIELPTSKNMSAKNFIADGGSAKKAKTYTISEVTQRPEYDDKYCLDFVESDKILVLNVTNLKAMVEKFGDDSDAWEHQAIDLILSKTTLNGDLVDSVRIV